MISNMILRGISWGKNGQQWETMGNNGQQWASMGNNGQQWATMGNDAQQWATIGNNGQQWTAMTTIHGATCIRYAVFVSLFNCHLAG